MNPVAPWLEMWLLCFALFGDAKLAVRLLAFVMRPFQTIRWLSYSWNGTTTTFRSFVAPLLGLAEQEP
jgi:hypothetical protein